MTIEYLWQSMNVVAFTLKKYASLVGPDGSVAAAEVNPDLAARAKQNLSSYPNVTVAAADGATFEPSTCDAMLINAGMTPPSPLWLDRLRDGGRLVVPLTLATTATLGIGVMAKIVRKGNGFSAQVVTPLAIYSCSDANQIGATRCARTIEYMRRPRCGCVREQRRNRVVLPCRRRIIHNGLH